MRTPVHPYEFSWQHSKLVILPGVYAPGFFSDSLWFASELPSIVGRRSLLEIGTGTGIIGIACARRGAHVVATDINPEAIKCAHINATRNKVDIRIFEGNLYDPIPLESGFDFIFWAHPFNNGDEPVRDMLLRSGFDYRYEGLRGFIGRAKEHLSPNGRLLLGTGDTADQDTIDSIARIHGYGLSLLRQAEMPLADDPRVKITYFILELIPNGAS
jgi:release factor glutamine methyltransferase